MIIRLVILLLLLPSVGLSQAPTSEIQTRNFWTAIIGSKYEEEDFAWLNQRLANYRQGTRTPSGVWMLTVAYNGIGSSACRSNLEPAYWEERRAKAQRWIDFNPTAPGGYLAFADAYRDEGWAHRGCGFVASVPESAWEPFRSSVELAWQYLIDHKEIASKDPYWYDLMVLISRDSGKDDEYIESVFEEGAQRHPYFYQLYFSYVNHLLPKWGGNMTLVEEFANRAVELTQEQESNGMYARVYWFVSQEGTGPMLFVESRARWQQMSEGIDDVLEKYPDQWNINHFAFFACMAGDREKTRGLIEMMNDEIIQQAWGSVASFELCRNWAYGLPLD